METSRTARCTRDQQGFTLSEVLVTIVIIGIVLAITTASWQNLTNGKRALSAVNQLTADMRLAHTNATNQLAEWRFLYKTDGSSFSCAAVADADYCLIKISSGATPTVTQSVPRDLPEGTRISGTTLTADSSLALLGFGSGFSSIRFKADGSAEASSPLGSGTTPRVMVSANSGSPRSVEVIPATSRVKVLD